MSYTNHPDDIAQETVVRAEEMKRIGKAGGAQGSMDPESRNILYILFVHCQLHLVVDHGFGE